MKIGDKSDAEKRDLLIKCSQTSLNSKLINKYKEFFSEMIVEAVLHLDEDLDKSDIGIKKITGGLNIELELKAERDNAEVRIDNPEEF